MSLRDNSQCWGATRNGKRCLYTQEGEKNFPFFWQKENKNYLRYRLEKKTHIHKAIRNGKFKLSMSLLFKYGVLLCR